MTETAETQMSPAFLSTKTVEVIYHLNGLNWTGRTLIMLAEQMERDGFTQNAQVLVDHKNKSAKVTEIVSNE
jgi:hypothetical protein